jgi:hypothetical protein
MNVYQFTSTEQKVTDNSEVHRSIQNCGSSIWNLLHVTLLASRIWRWHLDFRKKKIWIPATGARTEFFVGLGWGDLLTVRLYIIYV